MNKEELLKSYRHGYDDLAAIIETADKHMLYFKPAEDKWSAVEIIVHITDAECNGNVRIRKAIAESGSKVDVYDHNAWAKALDYQNRDAVTSLALFKLLRLNNYQVLSSLNDETWNNYVIHPDHGKITLLDILRIYTDHLHTHVKQIQRNFNLFNSLSEQQHTSQERT